MGGGALVSTQSNKLIRNWYGGWVKNPAEFCPFKEGKQECVCTKLMYGENMKGWEGVRRVDRVERVEGVTGVDGVTRVEGVAGWRGGKGWNGGKG